MTQVQPDAQTDPPPEGTDPEVSRRERAALEKRTRDAELTSAMLRAGLNPDEGMDKLFFESYSGDITAEAVAESAKGYGLIKPPETPTGDITDPDQRRQTGERQQTSTGVQPDGGLPSEDPRVTAIKDGESVMAVGGTQEAAMGRAFDTIAAAGFGDASQGRKPDTRAQWTPGEDDPRRPDLGW